MTTRRYTESDVHTFYNVPNYKILEFTLTDKLGYYGIISASIIKFLKDNIYIDTFLMSCRVLGRSVEMAILSYIIKAADEVHIKLIRGKFIPTAKNEPRKDFY